MKLLLRTVLVIVTLSVPAGFAIVQDWFSGSAVAYFVFFVAFIALAIWIFTSVFSKNLRPDEKLIACPKCRMRTDSLRNECMWCDQGLPES
ncbi:MAG: hypothetical protein V4495_04095 [Pseudomonadota bacterium]